MSTRGTSNSNDRGSAEARRKRKAWLFEVWAANVVRVHLETSTGTTTSVDVTPDYAEMNSDEWIKVEPLVRCFRCGKLLTWSSVEIDRIKPGCEGGRYQKNNIRPVCPTDNTILGEMAKQRKKEKRERANEQARLRRQEKK